LKKRAERFKKELEFSVSSENVLNKQTIFRKKRNFKKGISGKNLGNRIRNINIKRNIRRNNRLGFRKRRGPIASNNRRF